MAGVCSIAHRRLSSIGHSLVMWNENERKGKIDQVKGQVKQAVGALADDQPLKDEGQADEAIGKGEAAVGHAQRKVGEALTHLAGRRQQEMRATCG